MGGEKKGNNFTQELIFAIKNSQGNHMTHKCCPESHYFGKYLVLTWGVDEN